ncbi:hypothetical protein N431DRAFT_406675 [Stipitochalara longipes BDJ]|nr:hypothetical protein N431DRAFT_406675 [Stipitochalara longipes BDJ]
MRATFRTMPLPRSQHNELCRIHKSFVVSTSPIIASLSQPGCSNQLINSLWFQLPLPRLRRPLCISRIIFNAKHTNITMAAQFNFDRRGGKCYKLETFYRLCGHVEKSYLHTDMCRLAIADGHLPARQVGTFCWCPFRLGLHRLYCVGRCENCQQANEPGILRNEEPWINVLRGEGSTLDGFLGEYNPQQIRQRAQVARTWVEKQDRPTKAQTLEHESGERSRRRERELQWDRDWLQYKNGTAQAEQVPVLDLKDDFSKPRTADDLLELVPKKYSEDYSEIDCPICLDRLSKRSPYGEDGGQDFVVRVQGGCDHIFHHNCAIKLLVDSSPQCPICRRSYRYVLKNGFDDPKYRWIMEDALSPGDIAQHELKQVAGYIPVEQGRTQIEKKHFKCLDKEDRWGDRECR